jgi:hypothetical protein
MGNEHIVVIAYCRFCELTFPDGTNLMCGIYNKTA